MEAERVGRASGNHRCAENDDDAITRLSESRGQQLFFNTLHHLLSSGQWFHNAWRAPHKRAILVGSCRNYARLSAIGLR